MCVDRNAKVWSPAWFFGILLIDHRQPNGVGRHGWTIIWSTIGFKRVDNGGAGNKGGHNGGKHDRGARVSSENDSTDAVDSEV